MYSNVPPRIKQIVLWLDSIIVEQSEVSGQAVAPVPGILPLIEELNESFVVGNIINGSKPEFTKQSDQAIYDRVFPGEMMINLEHITWDSRKSEPFFKQIVQQTFITPGVCLLVDRHPVRSMAAIRSGLDCSIFLDTGRLRRDLWLWRIVESY